AAGRLNRLRGAKSGSGDRENPLTHSMTYLSLRASTATSTERTDHRAFAVMAMLWIAALWLICRPFRGIRHDAILYVGQTFNAMWPGQLSGDWFFLTASQDRY